MARRRSLEITLLLGLGALLGGFLLLRPLIPTATAPTECGALDDLPRLEKKPATDAEIARAVETLRGLSFDAVPEPERLTDEELRDRSAIDLTPHRSQLGTWGRGLATLRALESSADLTSFYSGAAATAFYEPATQAVVIPRSLGSVSGPISRIALAHELAHALVDQALGLPPVGPPPLGEEDRYLAARAMIEGDASLVEDAFTSRALGIGDQVQLGFTFGLGMTQAEAQRLYPHHLLRSAGFPYAEGARFACRLYALGGWETVNAAIEEPPETTAEILFPERYLEGHRPVTVVPVTSLPPKWSLAEMDFGAADLLFLLEAPRDRTHLAVDHPLRRARAWHGGLLGVWTRGAATAVGLTLIEHPDHGSTLCDSMARWAHRAFPGLRVVGGGDPLLTLEGPDTALLLRCIEGQVRVGVAEDLALAARAVCPPPSQIQSSLFGNCEALASRLGR